jgi:hypothetical protein
MIEVMSAADLSVVYVHCSPPGKVDLAQTGSGVLALVHDAVHPTTSRIDPLWFFPLL